MGIPFCLLKLILDCIQEIQFTLGAFEKAEARKVSLLCESACVQNRVSLQKWGDDCQESKSNLTKAGSGGHAVVEFKMQQPRARAPSLALQNSLLPGLPFSHIITQKMSQKDFLVFVFYFLFYL